MTYLYKGYTSACHFVNTLTVSDVRVRTLNYTFVSAPFNRVLLGSSVKNKTHHQSPVFHPRHMDTLGV